MNPKTASSEKQSNTPRKKRSIPKRQDTETILLAVTGMSPAILTETVWALAHEEQPIIPDRIVVLTSTIGRDKIVTDLFTPSPAFEGSCVWDALQDSFKKEEINIEGKLRFGTTGADIHIFAATDPQTNRSRELDDIRNPEENSAVADFILEEVRRIVENPDTRLVASIAGGRKTMGALLYACLTLIGRETDRLTHVLVNDPFDDPRLKPKFYFPGQPGGSLTGVDHSHHNPADAGIQLADVPFVPLRNLFQKELRRMPGRFSALVNRCRDRVEQVAAKDISLRIRRSQPEIEVNGLTVRLSASEYVIIRLLAQNVLNKIPPFDGYKQAVDLIKQMITTVLSESKKSDFSDWRSNAKQQGSFDFDPKDPETQTRWIIKNTSSLRTKLKQAGGAALGLLPLVPKQGRFSIELPAKNIEFIP